MANTKNAIPTSVTPIEALAQSLGISVPQALALVSNPWLWQILHGGYSITSYPGTFAGNVATLADMYQRSRILPETESKLVGDALLGAMKSLVNRGPAKTV